MRRSALLFAALCVAAASPAAGQRFFAIVSGEDPNHLINLSGTAYVCDYADGEFMVLSDSASPRGLSFLFHHPTSMERREYAFGGEEEGADIFVEYIPERRSDEYTGPGKLTLDALGPQGMHGEFTLTGTSRDGSRRAIVTGEITARSLGLLPEGAHCNPEAREAALQAHRWPAATLAKVRGNEVAVGMTGDMVLASWGLPRQNERTRTAAGSVEVWTYPNATVTLRNGAVAEIREQ
jgi:hypothetical protein